MSVGGWLRGQSLRIWCLEQLCAKLLRLGFVCLEWVGFGFCRGLLLLLSSSGFFIMLGKIGALD